MLRAVNYVPQRRLLLALIGWVVAGCNAGTAGPPVTAQVSPAATATAESPPSGSTETCIPEGLSGSYSRNRTAANTDDSDLLGAWTLTLDSCAYRIAVDGLEQGGGRVELVEGEAEAGRLALSEDLGCPNEFNGSGFYDFSLDGSSLTIEEAIAGTDLCEGRAEAFVGSPAWTR
jgi:hypothetical protein